MDVEEPHGMMAGDENSRGPRNGESGLSEYCLKKRTTLGAYHCCAGYAGRRRRAQIFKINRCNTGRGNLVIAIGVIGTGIMGSEHVRIIQEDSSGAHLAAVCDADEARARAAAPQSTFHADPLALIRSNGVDAVVIASSNPTHGDLVLACLAADKPVLCEKPLALSATECLKVIAAEEKKGRRMVQVGFMRRFDPPYRDLKRAVEQAALGRPLILHNLHRNPIVPDDYSAADALVGAFVHEIDVSRWLLGSEVVSARVQRLPGDDPLLITMETNKGEIVSTEVFMRCRYGYDVRAELVCSQGTIATVLPASSLRNHAGHHGVSQPNNWIPRFRTAYVTQMNEWIRSLKSEAPPEGANAWDGYVATALTDQIVAGIDDGFIKFSVGSRPNFYA